MAGCDSRFSSNCHSSNQLKSGQDQIVQNQFQDDRLRNDASSPKQNESKQFNKIIYKKVVKKFLKTCSSQKHEKHKPPVKDESRNHNQIDQKIRKNLNMVGLNIKSFPTQQLSAAQKFIFSSKKIRNKALIIENTPYRSTQQSLPTISNIMIKKKYSAYESCNTSKNASLQKYTPYKDNFQVKHKTSFHNTQSFQDSIKEQKFKQFIFLMNFSNQIYRNLDTNTYDEPVLYFVGKGNNHVLIRSIMKKRFWWKETKEMDKANFVWTQNKVSSLFSSQPIRKYQEKSAYTSHIINKSKIKTQNTKINNILGKEALEIYLDVLKKEMQLKRQVTFQWRSKNLRLKKVDIPTLVHNHLPGNQMIGNKKSLLFCLTNYQQITGEQVTIPFTFHVKQYEDKQYKKFISFYNKNKSQNKSNIWIIKPGQTSNRGNGIICSSNLQQITKIISQKSKNRTYIVQEYIAKPLLYNRRKFDIRTYMLVTIVNSRVKVYWYKVGYIRTSCKTFTLENLNDVSVHLTNDAVQKYDNSYGKYQTGNKLSYSEMDKYLSSNGKSGSWQKIYQKMKNMAKKTVRASYLFLDPDRKDNFQLFGLDFLVGDNLETYLLQIGCPVLMRIIPHLVQNVFQMTIDTQFPPPSSYSSSQKHNICRNPLQYNHFQLIFDEDSQGSQIAQLYKQTNIVSKQILQSNQQSLSIQ